MKTTQSLGPKPPRVLLAFDFDQSLIDQDSDMFVLQTLCPQLLKDVLASKPELPEEGYPKLSDAVFGMLHERMPELTREQLIEAQTRVPVSPRILETVKRAVDEYDVTVMILSDANELSIRSLLAYHQVEMYFSEIYANGSHWDGETSARLRITPHHPAEATPHGCGSCPRNLCKGFILDTIVAKNAFDKILYVGDGNNDVCAAQHLTSKDTVFARADSPDGRKFDLLKKLQHAPELISARVVAWATDVELCDELLNTLNT